MPILISVHELINSTSTDEWQTEYNNNKYKLVRACNAVQQVSNTICTHADDGDEQGRVEHVHQPNVITPK